MKRTVAFLLILSLIFALCGCSLHKANIVSTTSEQVDAVVHNTSVNIRWGYHYIHVAYGPAANAWLDENFGLYDYYKDHLGETIRCYLVTQEYDDGSVKYTLVYNETLHKGDIGDEPIRLENDTFPEGAK